jgi:hypothetical protein
MVISSNSHLEKGVAVVDDVKSPGKSIEVDEADLAKVRALAEAKMMRHRLDDYLSVIFGVGAALILWILQMLDVY